MLLPNGVSATFIVETSEDRSFLPVSTCRHVARTISSTCFMLMQKLHAVWRIVSEDSAALLAEQDSDSELLAIARHTFHVVAKRPTILSKNRWMTLMRDNPRLAPSAHFCMSQQLVSNGQKLASYSNVHWSFLLIACTDQIVTEAESRRFSNEYCQILRFSSI